MNKPRLREVRLPVLQTGLGGLPGLSQILIESAVLIVLDPFLFLTPCILLNVKFIDFTLNSFYVCSLPSPFLSFLLSLILCLNWDKIYIQWNVLIPNVITQCIFYECVRCIFTTLNQSIKHFYHTWKFPHFYFQLLPGPCRHHAYIFCYCYKFPIME